MEEFVAKLFILSAAALVVFGIMFGLVELLEKTKTTSQLASPAAAIPVP
jgi:hypothetical protein